MNLRDVVIGALVALAYGVQWLAAEGRVRRIVRAIDNLADVIEREG